jgi:hypothetical protein
VRSSNAPETGVLPAEILGQLPIIVRDTRFYSGNLAWYQLSSFMRRFISSTSATVASLYFKNADTNRGLYAI